MRLKSSFIVKPHLRKANPGDKGFKFTVVGVPFMMPTNQVSKFSGLPYQKQCVVCLCDCGVHFILDCRLINGKSKQLSCGCVAREKASARMSAMTKQKTHGLSGTRPYRIWSHMRIRCKKDKRRPKFASYYDNGISVCSEWKTFDGFWKWAQCNGYSDNLVIDRINPEGDYCPSNCQWITASENCSKVTSDRIAKIASLEWKITELEDENKKLREVIRGLQNNKSRQNDSKVVRENSQSWL